VWKKVIGTVKDHNLEVDSNGNVKVNNQTVVTGDSSVHTKSATINTTSGSMQAASASGEVTASNADGKTTVKHKGVGDITNDGSSYKNSDPTTQNLFKGWDPSKHEMKVMGGKNGSCITLDTSQNGAMQVKDSNGQVTTMSSDGAMTSVDSHGHTLLSIDSNGNVAFFNGLVVGADGSLSKQGSADAAGFDGGGAASTAVGQAMGLISNAMNSSNPGDRLSALQQADSILNQYASLYTATGHLDVVTMLQGKSAQVESMMGSAAQEQGHSKGASSTKPDSHITTV
jgi:hypothetical protein